MKELVAAFGVIRVLADDPTHVVPPPEPPKPEVAISTVAATSTNEAPRSAENRTETKLRVLIVPGIGGNNIYTSTLALLINEQFKDLGIEAVTKPSEKDEFSSDIAVQAHQITTFLKSSPTPTILLGYSSGSISVQRSAYDNMQLFNARGERMVKGIGLIAGLFPGDENVQRNSGMYAGALQTPIDLYQMSRFIAVATYYSEKDDVVPPTNSQRISNKTGGPAILMKNSDWKHLIVNPNDPDERKKLQAAQEMATEYAQDTVDQLFRALLARSGIQLPVATSSGTN